MKSDSTQPLTGVDLRILDTPEETASECADFILETLVEVRSETGSATLAISGGSSPRLLFQDMAKAAFDWTNVHFFFVDERCVPPDDQNSNYKLAHDSLFSQVDIKPGNVHRIWGELEPSEGAAKYVNEIKSFFGLLSGGLPAFDIIHRGMGPDAHTASLFPGSELVHDRTGIATNVWVEKFKMHRVTLLPGVLLGARRTVIQATGAEKADALKSVLEEPEDLLRFPCQIASRDPHTAWFLDRASASNL